LAEVGNTQIRDQCYEFGNIFAKKISGFQIKLVSLQKKTFFKKIDNMLQKFSDDQYISLIFCSILSIFFALIRDVSQ
jgi:hypothetical protein